MLRSFFSVIIWYFLEIFSTLLVSIWKSSKVKYNVKLQFFKEVKAVFLFLLFVLFYVELTYNFIYISASINAGHSSLQILFALLVYLCLKYNLSTLRPWNWVICFASYGIQFLKTNQGKLDYLITSCSLVLNMCKVKKLNENYFEETIKYGERSLPPPSQQ